MATKTPKNQRLAVTEKYNARLKALQKKGFNVGIAKEKILSSEIPGIKVSEKTGRIIIEAKSFSKNSKEITEKLEKWIPTVKNYAESNLQKQTYRVEKSEELKVELLRRAEEVNAKFGFNKDEYLDLAAKNGIDGISKDKSGELIVDPDFYTDEMTESALSQVSTADELIEAAKEKLMEEGLSEAEIEAKGDEGIIKKVKYEYMHESDTSVFKKYYKYFEKSSERHIMGRPKTKDSTFVKEHSSDYENATKKMSEIASILHDEGFSSRYYNEKAKLLDMLSEIK